MEESPQESRNSREVLSQVSAASLALTILMASMTMLFAASVVGYLITRAQNPVWLAEGMPGLPWGLFLSTALIALVSFAFRQAVAAANAFTFYMLTGLHAAHFSADSCRSAS